MSANFIDRGMYSLEAKCAGVVSFLMKESLAAGSSMNLSNDLSNEENATYSTVLENVFSFGDVCLAERLRFAGVISFCLGLNIIALM